MARIYNVIDSDGHVLEPVDLWEHYVDPKFRENCPQIVRDENGKTRLKLERDRLVDTGRSMGGLGAIGAREGKLDSQKIAYEEGRKGGFDPHWRIVDMDGEGIDAAFLYPSIGLTIANVKDPSRLRRTRAPTTDGWQIIASRIPIGYLAPRWYQRNRWKSRSRDALCCPGASGTAAGFYQPIVTLAPAAYSTIGVLSAVARSRRAELRNRYTWRRHPSGSGLDRFPDKASHAVAHCVAHTMEMMSAATSFIMCGICDRFPKLRVAFLESGGGWMAGWLDRWIVISMTLA